MSNLIEFPKRSLAEKIVKVIDGVEVELVCLDLLTKNQIGTYFELDMPEEMNSSGTILRFTPPLK